MPASGAGSRSAASAPKHAREDRLRPRDAVAGDDDAAGAARRPRAGQRLRRRHRRRVEHVEDRRAADAIAGAVRGDVRRGLDDAVARREHLAAVGLHPRDDGRAGAGVAGAGGVVRQELERPDRVHEPVADQREALDGGDANPQAGERARSGGDGVALDVAGRQAVRAENGHQIAGQALGVRSAPDRRRAPRSGRRARAPRCRRRWSYRGPGEALGKIVPLP